MAESESQIGPEIQPKENTFSGRVRIPTQRGIIELEIENAQVIRGRDILERMRALDHSQETHPALFNLEQILDKIQSKGTGGKKSLREWQEYRASWIRQDGEHSICTLLPEDWTNSFLARTVHHLGRVARTKEDLANLSDPELSSIRNIGEQSIPLAIAMRNAAIAQLESKQKEKAL